MFQKFNSSILMAFMTLFFSCEVSEKSSEESKSVGPDGWLSGTTEERLDEVAHQLGGFSRTMVEVSYRYSELYWAGQDENWRYAEHQLEHIIEAMEDGLKRRPVRAASAEDFMQESIPAMEALVEKEDKEAFLDGFKSFTTGCNACHAKEGESYILIQEPQQRTSPVRF
ncbi:hypothetical protein [Pararhodonellum marinum]|uniref:hypothetical protein n=1 Tax=Pararhodonellum marinum TaxID=2755358 RepID=UPI001E4F527B|nr:hypothetical protein [Pararhodonellum marinum]